jgi:hypothetical protein
MSHNQPEYTLADYVTLNIIMKPGAFHHKYDMHKLQSYFLGSIQVGHIVEHPPKTVLRVQKHLVEYIKAELEVDAYSVEIEADKKKLPYVMKEGEKYITLQISKPLENDFDCKYDFNDLESGFSGVLQDDMVTETLPPQRRIKVPESLVDHVTKELKNNHFGVTLSPISFEHKLVKFPAYRLDIVIKANFAEQKKQHIRQQIADHKNKMSQLAQQIDQIDYEMQDALKNEINHVWDMNDTNPEIDRLRVKPRRRNENNMESTDHHTSWVEDSNPFSRPELVTMKVNLEDIKWV